MPSSRSIKQLTMSPAAQACQGRRPYGRAWKCSLPRLHLHCHPGRLAINAEDLSPCPLPGALQSLTAAQGLPPGCGDRCGAGGLQGWAPPCHSLLWSRSTCAPGCRHRRRSGVCLQPLPREGGTEAWGWWLGQGRSPQPPALPTWLCRGPTLEGMQWGRCSGWPAPGQGGTCSSPPGQAGWGGLSRLVQSGATGALVRPPHTPPD